MAMTNAMHSVAYDKANFNFDIKKQRHPVHITERHYIYHLRKDAAGYLMCERDRSGQPIRSPRKLRSICLYKLIVDGTIMTLGNAQQLPTNIYPMLLTEAIFLKEAWAIEWVVSLWPMHVLRVYEMIPLEDCLEDDYLTLPFEGNKEVSLVDCFVLGLLKLRPESNLKIVDFTRFDRDRRLCKELCRLPVLWMRPADRTLENIHTYLAESLDITKDKVQCFLNRISAVYSNIESEFIHGNKIEPITICLDLHVVIDDVPIGLCLQHFTPFKFACSRLWMKPVPDVYLAPDCLGSVLDTSRITNFEYEDASLSRDDTKVNALLDGLLCLRNLSILSLPNCINVAVNQTIAGQLNEVLVSLRHLQRLNFSYCNLKERLSVLLGGLTQRIVYLNLKDCRLAEDDLFYLAVWRPLAGLRELNLSCNNLQNCDEIVVAALEKMPNVTCLSVSFCSLSIDSLVMITRECKECSRLKVLCMQGYTPPNLDGLQKLLHFSAQIRTLQKAIFFPESYAFPGNIEQDRESNKYHTMMFSYRFLEMCGRPDICLE